MRVERSGELELDRNSSSEITRVNCRQEMTRAERAIGSNKRAEEVMGVRG